MKIFLATGNTHKVDEIKAIFAGLEGIEIYSVKDGIKIPEVIEDGRTFEENSAKKALEIAKYTGMITIADDSGLCVDALGGAPGVYSARFSQEGTDEGNNKKLMEEMKDKDNRKCKFVSVVTLGKPDGRSYSFRGEVEGELLREARGSSGFGYDPYFYVKEYRKTLAEMPDIKNKISHRANALKKLEGELQKILKD
ncbi:RdgB/HAM1 family non-canonical purine NTP pyrophosphatase [Fusobacterium sp.]|uniref:RdgB/HAM1 family non-canonical purine NTP pyrophosphatase n=1 Tax=Fusobacterium sp. TaxID=68766 RepID=UPI00396CEC24